MKRWQQFEKAVIDLLRVYRIPFLRVSDYRCPKCHTILNATAKGMPDMLIFRPGLLAVELKTGKGRLTKEQKAVKALFERAGLKWLTLHDTVDDLLEELQL